MNILGITSGAESGAALFVDSRLCCAVNEERLTGIKLDSAYPYRSISWCLESAGLNPPDIDLICYGFSRGMQGGNFFADLMKRMMEYGDSPEEQCIITERLYHEARVDNEKRTLFMKATRNLFGNVPIYTCHHHQGHQANAFYPSPFSNALIITSDGRGDFKSLTIAPGRDNIIGEDLLCSYSWESLGYFYGRITGLCGFTPNRHEGKIVGLAAHGNPVPAMALMRKMIAIEDNRIRSYPGIYYRPFFTNYSDMLKQEAAAHAREDLAAAAQQHLEDIFCHLVRTFVRQTKLRNICLAGGTFANVKLNQRLRELADIEDVFIFPHMGDGGLCTGAVYHYLLRKGQTLSRHDPFSVYLGPEISSQQLAKRLQSQGYRVTRPNDLLEETVSLLEQGKIIALVQGRAEYGPRALGNRSILAKATDPAINATLNTRLSRSEFMPFAPVIADTFAPECLVHFNHQEAARFMTITYSVTKRFKENAPAVVHVDGTVRPQVVYEKDNPFLHQLLHHWYDRTGNLCLINTSCNLHEHPIASTDEDILATWASGALDCLLTPPYLVR